jgi:SAM-dependent methyltransferase
LTFETFHQVRERFRNASVAVLGSTQPWYEAMALTEGARRVVTIEHNAVSYRHPALHAYTHRAFFASKERPETFDVILSISSFEHDGLGRYGDPLDPDGDLRSMKEAAQILRPGGIMILAVPIARDAVVWNAHRVYGRARLRLLLQGWKLECSLGLHPEMLDQPLANPQQPLLILTRRRQHEQRVGVGEGEGRGGGRREALVEEGDEGVDFAFLHTNND